MRSADLPAMQLLVKEQHPNNLHSQARDFLNYATDCFKAYQEGPPMIRAVDPTQWPTWKNYLASLPEAEQILGKTGIVAIHTEQIEGVPDPNRDWARRVDIVVYNADGEFWRLHPGSTRGNNAKVRKGSYCIVGAPEPNGTGVPDPNAASSGAAARQYREAPPVLTLDIAANTPQNHLLSYQQMISKLEVLPKVLFPVELTRVSVDVFPWWLWIPNIGQVRDQTIGCGINRIALVSSTADRDTGTIIKARFAVVRTDETAVLLHAYRGRPYYILNLEKDGKLYNWWVHWRY